jgi:hypothetical protein
MNPRSEEVANMQQSQEFVKEVGSGEVAQTTIIAGDFNVSRGSSDLHGRVTHGYSTTQEADVHGTRIKWGYYRTFRAPIAPDLGSTDGRNYLNPASNVSFSCKCVEKTGIGPQIYAALDQISQEHLQPSSGFNL